MASGSAVPVYIQYIHCFCTVLAVQMQWLPFTIFNSSVYSVDNGPGSYRTVTFAVFTEL